MKGKRENDLHKQFPGEVFRAIPAQGGHALHTMTKAEVVIVIDHEGQRFVSGSLGLLETYNKGILKPTQGHFHTVDKLSLKTINDHP